ncbi:hypothetical protein [Nostoc sp.]
MELKILASVLESLLKSSHSVAGVPTPLALCLLTRPPQWLPVVGSGAAEPQEQLSAKSKIK